MDKQRSSVDGVLRCGFGMTPTMTKLGLKVLDAIASAQIKYIVMSKDLSKPEKPK